VFATWPAVLHLDEVLQVSDPMVYVWGLWWVADSIKTVGNPWWTSHLLAPDGTYLAFHALVPLAGAVMAPITWTFGAAVSLNLLKIVLPVVAALTGRFAARRFGLEPGPALVAGCLYGFSTIVVWRTTFHLNFGAGLALLPLAPAYVAQFAAGGGRRSALLAGAAVGLTLYADHTIAFFSAMLAALFGLCAVWKRLSLRGWLVGVLWMAAATLVVALPQLAMMARETTNGGYTPDEAGLATSWVPGSTSLQAMLSPANVRESFPGTLEARVYRLPYGEATPTFGWAVLILAALGLLLILARRRPMDLPRVSIAWAVGAAVVATLLALGPVLHLSTTPHTPVPVELNGQRLSALMPYTWLSQVPLFADMRIPARFTMLGILPVAILAGIGVQLLWNRGIAGRAIVVAALAFAVVESGFPDGGSGKQWTSADQPPLTRPIGADKSDSVVVEVPLGFVSGTAGVGEAREQRAMMLAARHHHPIANAYLSRMDQEKVAELASHRFYADLIALQNAGVPDAAIPLDRTAALADLDATRARWVIVRNGIPQRVVRYLKGLGFEMVARDNGDTLFHR